MLMRITLMASLVGLSAQAQEPPATWDEVYELPVSSAWLSVVWARSAEVWVAGGRQILVDALDGKIRSTSLPNLGVSTVANTYRGVFAAGSHGAIWRIDAQGIHLEHQDVVGEKLKGRDRHQILQIGEAELSGRRGILALSTEAIFSERPGDWRLLASDAESNGQFANDLLFARWFARPQGCDSPTWLSFAGAHREGILTCRDRRSILLRAEKGFPLAHLPPGCGNPVQAAGGRDLAPTILCDGKIAIWTHRNGEWHALRTSFRPSGIAATERCVFAVTQRTVWRQCRPAPASSDAPKALPNSRLPTHAGTPETQGRLLDGELGSLKSSTE